MLDDRVTVLILADFGTITGPIRERLSDWVEGGGLLGALRRHATGGRDRRSRAGQAAARRSRAGRHAFLGAAEAPIGLRAAEPVRRFEDPGRGDRDAPGAGRARARPAGQDLGATLRRHAAGDRPPPRMERVACVLFHVTADTTWSNLPISGLFVDMLKKIVALSGESARAVSETEAKAAQASRAIETVAPTRTLDGFGVLGPPPTDGQAGTDDIRGRRLGGSSAGVLRRGRVASRRQCAGARRHDSGDRSLRPRLPGGATAGRGADRPANPG